MENIAPLSIGGHDVASNASNQHQNEGPDEAENNVRAYSEQSRKLNEDCNLSSLIYL